MQRRGDIRYPTFCVLIPYRRNIVGKKDFFLPQRTRHNNDIFVCFDIGLVQERINPISDINDFYFKHEHVCVHVPSISLSLYPCPLPRSCQCPPHVHGHVHVHIHVHVHVHVHVA
jgi:hypothetical protein